MFSKNIQIWLWQLRYQANDIFHRLSVPLSSSPLIVHRLDERVRLAHPVKSAREDDAVAIKRASGQRSVIESAWKSSEGPEGARRSQSAQSESLQSNPTCVNWTSPSPFVAVAMVRLYLHLYWDKRGIPFFFFFFNWCLLLIYLDDSCEAHLPLLQLTIVSAGNKDTSAMFPMLTLEFKIVGTYF